MAAKSIGLHVALFTGALVLALRAWTAEAEPAKKHVAAELWSGPIQSVERVEFDSGKERVVVEPKTDAAGRYYIGTVEDIVKPPAPASSTPASGVDAGAPQAAGDPHAGDPHAGDPHAGDPHGHGDDGHGHGAEPPKRADNTPKPPRRFISLEKGEELVKSLSALKASRVLGKLADDRLAQFGLDTDDKGSLKVLMGGREHRLQLGDKTPGGNDRYVKNPDSGEAYVIPGPLVDDLTSAENRLVQREFHSWEEGDVAKVVIRVGDASREVVRHAVEKDFWSAPDSPDTKDETVSNWMTKLNRLRVTTYVDDSTPAPKPEDHVVLVEYLNSRGTKLGYIELWRKPSETEKDRKEYVAKSELTRWYTTVLRSSAEQVDQDLGSIVSKPQQQEQQPAPLK